MPVQLLLEADALVRRLSNGAFFIDSDPDGIHLVRAETGERACVARFVDEDRSSEATPGPDPSAVLSMRERQVFDLLGHGHDMHEISARLGLSVKTIETYRSRIKQKLGIKNRARLLTAAIELRMQRSMPIDGSSRRTESLSERTGEIEHGPIERNDPRSFERRISADEAGESPSARDVPPTGTVG